MIRRAWAEVIESRSARVVDVVEEAVGHAGWVVVCVCNGVVALAPEDLDELWSSFASQGPRIVLLTMSMVMLAAGAARIVELPIG